MQPNPLPSIPPSALKAHRRALLAIGVAAGVVGVVLHCALPLF